MQPSLTECPCRERKVYQFEANSVGQCEQCVSVLGICCSALVSDIEDRVSSTHQPTHRPSANCSLHHPSAAPPISLFD